MKIPRNLLKRSVQHKWVAVDGRRDISVDARKSTLIVIGIYRDPEFNGTGIQKPLYYLKIDLNFCNFSAIYLL